MITVGALIDTRWRLLVCLLRIALCFRRGSGLRYQDVCHNIPAGQERLPYVRQVGGGRLPSRPSGKQINSTFFPGGKGLDTLCQIGAEQLTEGPRRVRHGPLPILGNDLVLTPEGLPCNLRILPHKLVILRHAGEIRVAVGFPVTALDEREGTNQKRQDLLAVEKVVWPVARLRVVGVELWVGIRPEPLLKLVEQTEAVPQALETVKVAVGLGNPGCNLQVFGLGPQCLAAEPGDGSPVGGFLLGFPEQHPASVERLIPQHDIDIGAAVFTNCLIIILVGEVTAGGI